MVDFLIGLGFVAMILLPAVVAFFQQNRAPHGNEN
jgi:hypothetical protein